MSMLRGFYAHFLNLLPGMVGLVDCKCLLTHLKNEEITTETFLVRHFMAIQHTVATQELGNVYWHPGSENPADGLTKTERDVAALLRLSEPETYDPGALRSLKGALSGFTRSAPAYPPKPAPIAFGWRRSRT